MKKIAIIIPYFGKLPSYFEAWKNTVLKNNTIDFYFFTDIQDLKSEYNLHVVYCTFNELKERIQKNFNFPIVLDSPYKLCDYKPVYGKIFNDILSKYDFWGYCDIDLLFGNIRRFLTDEVLSKNDRILLFGHLSLYKNNDFMNNLYKIRGVYPEKNYYEVFKSNKAFYFDEYGGMEIKCLRSNVRILKNAPIANFLPIYPYFEYRSKAAIIEWDNGNLYCIRENDKEELLYAHFSKRQFKIIENENKNIIVVRPNEIIFGRKHKKSDICRIKFKKIYRIIYLFKRNKNSKNTLLENIKRYKWSKDISEYLKKNIKRSIK